MLLRVRALAIIYYSSKLLSNIVYFSNGLMAIEILKMLGNPSLMDEAQCWWYVNSRINLIRKSILQVVS